MSPSSSMVVDIRPPKRGPRTMFSEVGNSRALLRFVVKKHFSKRLHYDFRLELNGVLISFVIVEGPSADPLTSRTAIRVADHDLRYIDSERLIPEGEYGAGPVMVWDRGIWWASGNSPAEASKESKLEFELRGERLRGRWMLARKDGQWELTKMMDEHAQLGNPNSLVTKYTNSVITGRTIEEIRDGKSDRKNQDDQLDLWDK